MPTHVSGSRSERTPDAAGAAQRVADVQHQCAQPVHARRSAAPVKWILAYCPELRIRARVGENLDAEVIEALRHAPATVASLARHTGATYSATHEAVTRLRGRGLVEDAGREGQRRLVLPEQVRLWLETFPVPESQRRLPERAVA